MVSIIATEHCCCWVKIHGESVNNRHNQIIFATQLAHSYSSEPYVLSQLKHQKQFLSN